MGQSIGNVGILNLLHATEESIKGIDRLSNVGIVIYRKETAHLMTLLKISNIGRCIELPDGYRIQEETLHLNGAYLDSLEKPLKLLANAVIVDADVTPEQLKKGLLHLIVQGNVYAPKHLTGLMNLALSEGSQGSIHPLEDMPRTENGKLTLTNAYLASLNHPLNLTVNGILSLAEDLDMAEFQAKLGKITVNGKAVLYESQEAYFLQKTTSAPPKVEIIPKGFELLKDTLRLNGRSIRRFKGRSLYTKKPVVLEADITREALTQAIAGIRSTSVIAVPEHLEDLAYELCPDLNAEIIGYSRGVILIDGEEAWSADQLEALREPASFIVTGKLTLEPDVLEDTLRQCVEAFDLFGEIAVPDKTVKGAVYSLLRTNKGSITIVGDTPEAEPYVKNIGILSL